MMKFQLQSVDIFRIDPVIWGAMERIFKIQTGLYNVKQTEALPMFKLPLCLFSTNHRFLFSLYPSLSCLSGEFLIHTKISGTDINVSLLLAHFHFISLLDRENYQIVGTHAPSSGAKKPFLTPQKPEAANHLITSLNLLLTALVDTWPQL